MRTQIFCLTFSFIILFQCNGAIAQNSYERQIKYWYLRDRLRHFTVPSDDPLNVKGSFLVMTSRNRNWKDKFWFTNIADFGQEMSAYGKYIGVLATEYYLLTQWGRYLEAQETNIELLLALQAYKRLDLCEDNLDPPFPWPIYDGFFIRHDVPPNIGSNNPFLINSGLNEDAGILLDYDPLLDEGLIRRVESVDGGMTPFNEFMSQDEACFLLEGLALTYKFGSGDAKTIAEEYAYKVLNRLYGYTHYLHYYDWFIRSPYGHTTQGGNCNFLSYGYSKLARNFFGFYGFIPNPISQPIWEALWNGLLPGYNAHIVAGIAAIGKGWGSTFHKTQHGIFNNTDQDGWDYYYLWLYKALWDDTWSLYNVDRIEDRLDEAPCEGPWLETADNYAPNGWASPDKWHCYLDEQYGITVGNVGIFSGLDYMILLNLYYINNGQGLSRYRNRINTQLNQPWPTGGVGSIVDPYYIKSFRTITSTDILYGQPLAADVSYQAGEIISLLPGFKVEHGAHFHAVITPLEYCTNPVTDMGMNSKHLSYHHVDRISHKTSYTNTSFEHLYYYNKETKSDNLEQSPDNIVVYPNPCRGVLNIVNTEGYHQFEIRTLYGELISIGNISSNKFLINLSNCMDGLYLLILKAENKSCIKKISLIR